MAKRYCVLSCERYIAHMQANSRHVQNLLLYIGCMSLCIFRYLCCTPEKGIGSFLGEMSWAVHNVSLIYFMKITADSVGEVYNYIVIIFSASLLKAIPVSPVLCQFKQNYSPISWRFLIYKWLTCPAHCQETSGYYHSCKKMKPCMQTILSSILIMSLDWSFIAIYKYASGVHVQERCV